jgi:hypothetical protein
MSSLKAWRTPFEAEEFPSVWVTCSGLLNDTVVSVGRPARWHILFEHVVGHKVCGETYVRNSRFHIERDDPNVCSYTWDDSPWLADFDTEYVETLGGTKVIHYVLLGGDYIVELLAHGKVEIESVDNSAS